MERETDRVKVDSSKVSYFAMPTTPTEAARRYQNAINLAGSRLSRGRDEVGTGVKPEITADRITRVAYKFGTYAESSNAFTVETAGFVHYVDEASEQSNRCIILDFYLEKDLFIEEVILRERFYDAMDPFDDTYRLNNVSTYLNPTRTATTSAHTTPANKLAFYRYSAGTKLIDEYDPTADLDEKTYTFSQSDIAALNIGDWNYLVLQQDTEDTALTNFGHATIDLLILGYLAN